MPTALRTITRTHCPYCAFQCGMTLAPRDGKLEVAADELFPVNRGQMCIKGFTSGELLTAPGRLTTPLVRDASGALQPASWDEALDHIATTMLRLRDAHGPESLAAFGSGALTNEKAYLLGKFVRLALRSPNLDYNGRYCMASAAAGQTRAFGVDRGLPFPVADIAGAGCVTLWGSNLADTLPPILQYFAAQRDNGGRLVVVDPRRTDTARDADLHLQLTPGSDVALANGLLYLAIEEGLIDPDFIAARTADFDLVRRSVGRYHPAHAERITGVSENQMRRAVRLIAGAEGSMLLTGRGPEQQSKGVDGVLALVNLMLALGKIGKPNGGYGTLTGQGNGQGGREHGQKADQLPGYRLIENPRHRAEIAAVWGVDPAALPGKGMSAVELIDACGTGGSGGVRAMLVVGSNLVVATPRGDHVADKLKSLELLVVLDHFMNDTAELAHVVLPTLQFAEEDGTMTNLEGRVIRRRKAVEPPDGPRSDLDVLNDLADRLGAGELFPAREPEAIFDELCRATAGGPADYSGITYDLIDRHDGVHWPCPPGSAGTPRLFADRFAHPDGLARFVPVDHRPAGEEPDAAYPLWLTTGRYKQHYNTGAQTRRVGPLLDARPAPRVQMHPRLAARLNVVDGGPVRVETRRAAAVFDAEVTADIRPDTLFVPFHYGGKAAVNRLTNAALDPVSKMPEFKVCAARASAADHAEAGNE